MLRSAFPFIPILGEDVRGNVDGVGEPPGMAAFSRDHDWVSVKES